MQKHWKMTFSVKTWIQTIPQIFILTSIVVASFAVFSAPVFAQVFSSLSVPATIVRELAPPGTADGFLRPEGIFVDNRFAEVFVSDPGHNRIVVFDTSGLYKFEFSCADIFGSPGEVVVDSRGFIFVLGSTGSGKSIYQFDYDGTYLHELRLTGLPQDQILNLGHLTIDESDKLYVVDGDQAIIYAFDLDGILQKSFTVLTDLPESQRRDAIFGSPTVIAGLLYLPVSTFGAVYVYDLGGNFVRTIGDEGTDIGKLNFPVAVAVSPDSIIMVLDKHRFNVVCFSADGQFVGEFGGMGYRRGWFYHPNSLAIDNQGRCYITQIYLNLVQVCDPPKSFIEKARLTTSECSPLRVKTPVLATKGEEVSRQLSTPILRSKHFSTFYLNLWRFFYA